MIKVSVLSVGKRTVAPVCIVVYIAKDDFLFNAKHVGGVGMEIYWLFTFQIVVTVYQPHVYLKRDGNRSH